MRKKKVIDTKEKLLNELEINSLQELSNENIFRKIVTNSVNIDKELLGLILPNIANFNDLVVKQQEFLTNMAEKQKQLDEKTIESFNKTKEIISQLLNSNQNLDNDTMIFLVETLKELDRMIFEHTENRAKRFNNIINMGLQLGGIVLTIIVAVIFKGKGGGKQI